jgi:hypothetical protein
MPSGRSVGRGRRDGRGVEEMIDAIPPQIVEVISEVRDLYVSHFVSMLSAFAEKKIITEAILLDKFGKPFEEGTFHLSMRSDVYDVGKKSMGMIASSQQLDFRPFSFQLAGATVHLEPFLWDRASVTANIAPSDKAIGPLLIWFRREFKGDIVSGDGEELNCVHFMSEPKAVSGYLQFELDLGTAKTSAFSDLLATLVSAGSTDIVISAIKEGQ